MWDGLPFNGTKIALFSRGAVLVFLRDIKQSIPWPGLWDLLGGGREGDESPVECALREVEEEFGIRIPVHRVTALHRHDGGGVGNLPTYFCIGTIAQAEVDQIVFGDEGQRWQLIDPREFINRSDAVPHMQERLARHAGL